MNAVISFFLGLGLIILKRDLLIILKNDIFYSYQWIVSIIGIILMWYGTKYYIELKNRMIEKKEESVEILKKIENNMLTVSSFEKIVSQLDGIKENQKDQKQILINISAQSEKINLLNKTSEKIDNRLEDVKEILLSVKKLQLKSVENVESTIQQIGIQTEKVVESVKNIQELPEEIIGMVEEIDNTISKNISEITENIESIVTNIENLAEDLNNINKKNWIEIIKKVEEINKNNDEKLSEQIKILKNQYSDFEKMINEMIKQITQMSKKDYEIMKGFING